MDTRIEKLEPVLLAGFQQAIRDGQEYFQRERIPLLWEKYRGHRFADRIDNRRYALIMGDLPGQEEEQATYLAAAALSKLPEETPADLTTTTLEAGEWLCVEHAGPPQTLGNTTRYLFAEWLPQSIYVPRANLELCIFPDGTVPKYFTYCLPVKKGS